MNSINKKIIGLLAPTLLLGTFLTTSCREENTPAATQLLNSKEIIAWTPKGALELFHADKAGVEFKDDDCIRLRTEILSSGTYEKDELNRRVKAHISYFRHLVKSTDFNAARENWATLNTEQRKKYLTGIYNSYCKYSDLGLDNKFSFFHDESNPNGGGCFDLPTKQLDMNTASNLWGDFDSTISMLSHELYHKKQDRLNVENPDHIQSGLTATINPLHDIKNKSISAQKAYANSPAEIGAYLVKAMTYELIKTGEIDEDKYTRDDSVFASNTFYKFALTDLLQHPEKYRHFLDDEIVTFGEIMNSDPDKFKFFKSRRLFSHGSINSIKEFQKKLSGLFIINCNTDSQTFSNDDFSGTIIARNKILSSEFIGSKFDNKFFLDSSVIDRTLFEGCLFGKGSRIVETEIYNSTFEDCTFDNPKIQGTAISNCEFNSCDFSRTPEILATSTRCIFRKCTFPNTPEYIKHVVESRDIFVDPTFVDSSNPDKRLKLKPQYLQSNLNSLNL
jgi:uncharacterized protein YjbI with pentapeptide repeats